MEARIEGLGKGSEFIVRLPRVLDARSIVSAVRGRVTLVQG